MSADNGIYLVQFKDGWRVAHLQGIYSIYWHPTCCDNPDVHETYACNLAEANSIEDIYYHEQCNNCKTIDPEWEQREQINPNTIYNYFKDSRCAMSRVFLASTCGSTTPNTISW